MVREAFSVSNCRVPKVLQLAIYQARFRQGIFNMMKHDRDPILVYTLCIQKTPYTFRPFVNRCRPSLVLLLVYIFLITLGGCKKNVDDGDLAKPSGNAKEPSTKHSIELSREQIERTGIQTTLAKLVVYQRSCPFCAPFVGCLCNLDEVVCVSASFGTSRLSSCVNNCVVSCLE